MGGVARVHHLDRGALLARFDVGAPEEVGHGRADGVGVAEPHQVVGAGGVLPAPGAVGVVQRRVRVLAPFRKRVKRRC